MSTTVNLQPAPNDNTNNLLAKILRALNLYNGGVLPTANPTVEVEGTVVTATGAANVGGFTDVIQVTPAYTAAAYLAGDSVGTPSSLLTAFRTSYGQKSAILQSVTIIDKSNVGPNLYLCFGRQGAFQGVADNAAFAWTDAQKLLGIVELKTADYLTLGAYKVQTKAGIGLALDADTLATAQVDLAIVVGTGFTATVNSGITLQLGFLQD